MASDLLTTQDVAERCRAPESTVRYWRATGAGPPGFKVGRRVVYRAEDVDAWLNEQRAAQAAEAR